MKPNNIAVIESPETLRQIAADLLHAADTGCRVRITVDGGVKVAVGGGMWTINLGRLADATGN